MNRVTDYLSLIAEDKGIVLEVTGDAKILGGRLLVQRAITNLVSNAVRHAATNSKVTLAIAAEGKPAEFGKNRTRALYYFR